MATGTSAYLVVRRDDGFGDVFPLDPGNNYTLGRAATNSVVVSSLLVIVADVILVKCIFFVFPESAL